MFKVIALEGNQWEKGRKSATLQTKTFYVKSVRWAESGLQIAQISSTADRAQAARFRPETAAVLAEQLTTNFGLFPAVETV
jgi:hypothetical protein